MMGISKSCTRCNKGIQCRVDAIEECACTQIKLSPECLDYLKKTKYDCLCNECLSALDRLVIEANAAPTTATENIHYYLEDGLLVFTELQHIQRGHCCESDCRHCAYGFRVKN